MYSEKMSQLKEKPLLMEGVRWLICLFIMSIVACLFPYGQAITPVHEGDTCICYFFYQKNQKTYTLIGYPFISVLNNDNSSYYILQFLNILMFYTFNWVFLFINIWSVYRIRHNRDRLEVRREMFFVTIFWSLFCALQYIFYAV